MFGIPDLTKLQQVLEEQFQQLIAKLDEILVELRKRG